MPSRMDENLSYKWDFQSWKCIFSELSLNYKLIRVSSSKFIRASHLCRLLRISRTAFSGIFAGKLCLWAWKAPPAAARPLFSCGTFCFPSFIISLFSTYLRLSHLQRFAAINSAPPRWLKTNMDSDDRGSLRLCYFSSPGSSPRETPLPPAFPNSSGRAEFAADLPSVTHAKKLHLSGVTSHYTYLSRSISHFSTSERPDSDDNTITDNHPCQHACPACRQSKIKIPRP